MKTLTELRAAYGPPLSQRDLARILGVTPGAVGNWEAGLRVPRLTTARRIAGIFGVRVDDIVFGPSPSAWSPGGKGRVKRRKGEDAMALREEEVKGEARPDAIMAAARRAVGLDGITVTLSVRPEDYSEARGPEAAEVILRRLATIMGLTVSGAASHEQDQDGNLVRMGGGEPSGFNWNVIVYYSS